MSPDISLCIGGLCPLKEKCYRYLAKPSEYQSYFADPPFVKNKCEYLVKIVKPKKKVSNKCLLKK